MIMKAWGGAEMVHIYNYTIRQHVTMEYMYCILRFSRSIPLLLMNFGSRVIESARWWWVLWVEEIWRRHRSYTMTYILHSSCFLYLILLRWIARDNRGLPTHKRFLIWVYLLVLLWYKYVGIYHFVYFKYVTIFHIILTDHYM